MHSPSKYTQPYLYFRKLQVECDEKLQNIYQKLLQAGVEKHESEKEAKLKETLANLQRLFPGKFCFSFLTYSIMTVCF